MDTHTERKSCEHEGKHHPGKAKYCHQTTKSQEKGMEQIFALSL